MSLERKRKPDEVTIETATIKDIRELDEISGKYEKGILHVIKLFGETKSAQLLTLKLDDGNSVEIRYESGEVTCRIIKGEKNKDE